MHLPGDALAFGGLPLGDPQLLFPLGMYTGARIEATSSRRAPVYMPIATSTTVSRSSAPPPTIRDHGSCSGASFTRRSVTAGSPRARRTG